MAAAKRCVDCDKEGILTNRKAPHPGPRCHTHHRARRLATRNMSWERRLLLTYGITAEEYWAIYEHQDGRCYICRRATGTGRRKLSVDHCHATGFVRGLLCNPCNKSVLGHLRDDHDALVRAADYITTPPAWAVIGKRFAPVTDLTSNGEK